MPVFEHDSPEFKTPAGSGGRQLSVDRRGRVKSVEARFRTQRFGDEMDEPLDVTVAVEFFDGELSFSVPTISAPAVGVEVEIAIRIAGTGP